MGDLSVFAEHPYRFIRNFLGEYFGGHLLIFAAVATAVTCSVSTQYGVKMLVDALSDPGRHTGIWTAFAILASLIAADNLLWRVAAWTGHATFVGVSGSIRRNLFEHLTGHAPSYFSSRASASLTSRISATATALYMTESMVTFNALPPLIATTVSMIYLATVSPEMALCLTAIAAIVVVIMFRWAANGALLHYDYASHAARVDGEMNDIVSNITVVKSFGRLRSEHARLGSVIEGELDSRKRSLYYLEKLRIFHAAITAVMIFGLLAWAISLWQAKLATTGQVVLVCTLGLSILSATRDLAVALVDVTQYLSRLTEALRTLLVAHELPSPANARHANLTKGAVKFCDVSFAYPSASPVIDAMNFHIEPGTRLGIVGPSGAGKSTIFALMQRFYEPQAGGIFIDGENTNAISDDDLRGAIAVVPQDVTLFHRTLRENIRYGRPDATDDEVWNAAQMARCLSFIRQLPDGLDTIVGDRGSKLSGGQRQRIAIARAFLKDSPILLLDEATSALDAHSEELIREALTKLMDGRTVVAIAHRLSTLRSFDRIMVVQNGRVVQDGGPAALLSRKGAYKSLVDLEFSRLRGIGAAA